MGGPGSMVTKTCFSDITVRFWSRRWEIVGAIEPVTYVDSTGINRLAVRLQKLHFMKSLFVKIFKVEKHSNPDTRRYLHFCSAL